jgi:hypothetical protein
MEIKLYPKFNKNNKQISFDLKKLELTKEVRNKLPNLKSIKLNIKDFEF